MTDDEEPTCAIGVDLEYDEMKELIDDLIENPSDSEKSPAALLDNFLDHLHGRTTPANQSHALKVLREGFTGCRSGMQSESNRASFVEYCLCWRNDELVRRVAEAGPPPGFEWPLNKSLTTAHLALPAKARWLDHLCGHDYTRANTRSLGLSDVYGVLLQRLSPSSAPLLRYAHALAPEHPGITAPKLTPMDQPRFPGNLHYALLHAALNGTIHLDDVFSWARTVKQEPVYANGTTLMQHEAALECLEYLREAGVPCRLSNRVPLDAQPFAMACGHGRDLETVKVLMQAYIAAGALDIDAPLHMDHEDVGGCLPLDVAIHAGGPAAAFIDLGCNLDPGVVCQVYGGDPVRAAQEQRRHQVAAEVAEALMRRKIAESVTNTAAEGEVEAPRRARARARV